MPVPVTKILTSHSLTIRVAGKEIGSIQSWAPSQSRDMRPKYEISATGIGNILEFVPGNMTAQTLQVSRYDLHLAAMEEIWGFPKPLVMLQDQHNPFVVEEKWIKYGNKARSEYPWDNPIPKYNVSYMLNKLGGTAFGKELGFDSTEELESKGIIPQGMEVSISKQQYTGCWFTQLGRQHSAEGNRIVNVNATLVYTNLVPVI